MQTELIVIFTWMSSYLGSYWKVPLTLTDRKALLKGLLLSSFQIAVGDQDQPSQATAESSSLVSPISVET